VRPAHHLVEVRLDIVQGLVLIAWLVSLIKHPLNELAPVGGLPGCDDALVEGLSDDGDVGREKDQLEVGHVHDPQALLLHILVPRNRVRGCVVANDCTLALTPAKSRFCEHEPG
jgi:hypothetical protein